MINRTHPASLALVATVGAAAFAVFPTGSPPTLPTSAPTLAQWWEADSVGAAITTIRLMAVVGCSYVAAVAALCAVADLLRLRWLRSLVLALATPTLRRRLTAGALVAAIAVGSTPAHAQSTPDEPSIVLVDLGPAPPNVATPPAIVLHDLGPAETARLTPDEPADLPDPVGAATTLVPPDPPPAAIWVVERGDHLWAIAEATLAAHERSIDVASVTDYWLALIEANAARLGDDPDLIHPGQVLRLPPPAQG